MTDRQMIQILTVHHKHGQDVFLCDPTTDQAKEILLSWAQADWDDQVSGEIPADDDEVIRVYFDTVEEEWVEDNFIELPHGFGRLP